MSIDPAAFTRTDSISSTILPVKPLATSSSSTPKASKTANTPQRLEYEQIYTGLKVAVGDRWTKYQEAFHAYAKGESTDSEFSLQVDQALQGEATAVHLHNELLSRLYANVARELPDHGVALWVSANDKPTIVSKPVSGDAAEQRLKNEVMNLPPRDRRRLKGIPDPAQIDGSIHNMLEEYHQAKQIRLPDNVPASAGGLNKTNWDPEIRKRYGQPLASETLEFPDADTILARITPICYEESLPHGTTAHCAELVAIATETFVKDTLSLIFSRTRANGPSSNGGGIRTQKYRKQLQFEEEGWLKGEVEKSSGSGMFPVEVREAASRRPLGMADLRLALHVGGSFLLGGQMPLLQERVMGAWLDGEGEVEDMGMMIDEDVNLDLTINGGVDAEPSDPLTVDGDAMEVDENDYGWEGGKESDRQELGRLLDECLSSL